MSRPSPDNVNPTPRQGWSLFFCVQKLHYLAILGVVFLISCGGDKSSGIEVGNPALAQGVSTRFLVDYGEPIYPFLARMASQPSPDEPVIVDSLRLELVQVRHRSSFYVDMGTERPDGIVIWPPQQSRQVYPVIFSADGNQSLPALEVGPVGYLKEMGYSFRSSGGPAITGSFRNSQGLVIPFEFHLPTSWWLDLFYHRSQLTLGPGGRYSLDVHFHVPNWVRLWNWETLVVDSDGVIRLSPARNGAAFDALSRGLPTAFDALRHILITGDPPDTTHALHPQALSRMNALGMQRVRNNNFADNAEDWIFQVQFGAAANFTIMDSAMHINVSNGGSYEYSVQVIQEDFAILKDSCYKLEFVASSNVEGIITVRMGQYHSPYAALAQSFSPRLTVQPQYFAHWVVPLETNPFARIEFNMGRRARNILLREVRFTQRRCMEMP